MEGCINSVQFMFAQNVNEECLGGQMIDIGDLIVTDAQLVHEVLQIEERWQWLLATMYNKSSYQDLFQRNRLK